MNGIRALGIAVRNEISDDGLSWIEVLPTADKVRNGQWYFTITRDDLETFAADVRARPNQIPVDYDHEGDTGGSTRAAGWFTGQAEVRDTEGGPRLLAEVKWTPRAIEEIRAGEFRFISAVTTFANRDRRTGLATKAKALAAATLTNRPFFDQLAPVLAHELLDTEQLDGLTARFGEPMGRLLALAALLPAEHELSALAREVINDEGDEPMSDTLKVLASELGLAEDADEESVLAAVKAVKAKAETAGEGDGGEGDGGDESTVRLDKETVARLTASAAKGEEAAKKLHDLERDTILAKAVEEGKIMPVQKDAYAAMYDVDAENVKALLAVTPVRSFAERGSGESGDDGEGDESAMRAARKRLSYEASSAGRFEPDDESLELHVEAEKILAAAGKKPGQYSEAEYREALFQARGVAA